MVLDLNRMCDSIFAYLYKHYKTNPNELTIELPTQADFVMPGNFPLEIGECQIAINKLFRPYFQEVYQKVGKVFCRSEQTFSEIVNRRCLRLHNDHSSIQLLIYCAVISELNFYCFQQGCFRYSSYAPKCLTELIQSCSQSPMGEFGGENVDSAVEKLKDYCQVLLHKLEQNPDHVPDYVEELGQKFRKLRDMPPYTKVVMVSPTKICFKEDISEEDFEDGASGGAAAQASDICKLCKETQCSSYLREFEANFNLTSFGESS